MLCWYRCGPNERRLSSHWSRYSIHLLYWYKSTHTDAAAAAADIGDAAFKVLHKDFSALLVQKYTY